MDRGDSGVVELEEGWRFLAAGVAKIRRTVEAGGEFPLSSVEFLELYTTVFNMCTQKPPHDYSSDLYERYKEDTDTYVKSTFPRPLPHYSVPARGCAAAFVLDAGGRAMARSTFQYPYSCFLGSRETAKGREGEEKNSKKEQRRKKGQVLSPLKEMHGELLLRGLVEGWSKYNLIVKFQIMVFQYLGRYYIPKKALVPPLRKILNEIKSTVTAIVIGMIDDEREGKHIDRDLLNNVLDVFVQTGDGNLDIYRDDFEQTFFNATRNYYSRKAQTWNKDYSDHDYMLKVEECLQKEKERVAHYLHSSAVDT
ncbi:Cullin-1 [Panicum miliaceum]|uniref:Cullin-1 n=1 Tax=Panicum miliaceum TaxID=4540 RepID=A0A3L6TGB3_PANMI|nr:Cullin-1 [Panicum miliaceum]